MFYKRLLPLGLLLLFTSCVSVPDNVQPVTGFEIDRYLGQWYEIARLDHSFEEDLQRVTATYSMNNDGTVHVVNRGFDVKEGKWSEAVGKAKFVQAPSTGFLKVSFFGPFYGSYVIFELDKQGYSYAFVTGGKNTLWLLAREPQVEQAVLDRFLAQSKSKGYPVNELIYVKHEQIATN